MKNKETQAAQAEQNEATLDNFISKIDTKKVEDLAKQIDEYKSELKDKEYALSLDKNLLSAFESFMREKVEWRSKEALGVKEILKRIDSVKKEGIKDGVCYFTNLEVEASHYFILKWSGQGSAEVDKFINLWKVFEETLVLIQQDNAKMEDLKKQFAAAEQGLELN